MKDYFRFFSINIAMKRSKGLFFAVTALLCHFSIAAHADELVIQPGLDEGNDSVLYSAMPYECYGQSQILEVGNYIPINWEARSLIRFDIPALLSHYKLNNCNWLSF